MHLHLSEYADSRLRQRPTASPCGRAYAERMNPTLLLQACSRTPARAITVPRTLGLALLASAVLLSACSPAPDGAGPAVPTAAGAPATSTTVDPATGTTTTTTTTVVTTRGAASQAAGATSPSPTVVAPVKHRAPAATVAQATTAPAAQAAVRDEPVAPRPVGQLGNITAIDDVKSDPVPTNGAGAVIGGLLGGVLGNQVGGGDGKKAATVIGAVGGAVAGNNVQRNRDRTVVGYRLHITLDNGQVHEVIVPSRGDWHTGDRVRYLDGVARPV